MPTPAELIERVELRRAVADEVLAFAEPYRSTVLVHYAERSTFGVAARGPAATAGVATGDHVVTIDGAALDGLLPMAR